MKSGRIYGLGFVVSVSLINSAALACQTKNAPLPTNPQRRDSPTVASPRNDRALPRDGSDSLIVTAKDNEAFDGEAAYATLKAVVALGPRITGSEAMAKQQAMLQTHFESLGGTVWFHTFPINHPLSGRKITVKNMIVTWHPERRERIMLCAHYDTRPQADKDPKFPKGKFHGANDNASGVGLLFELGRHMPAIEAEFGVDFVFFDAEEFVFDAKRDPLLVGSTGFANSYAATDPKARKFSYQCAVLVDMIGDAHLDLYWEKNSVQAAEDIVREIWSVAAELQVVEFRPEIRHEIRDDHLPLINIAKIPSVDIIDFDFPTINSKNEYWHTQKDIPENCSADSLFKVGSVLLEWIKRRAAK